MDYVEFGDVYLFHQRKNLQNQTIFERTSKKVSFPLMLSQEPGFAGLLQSKLHQIIYFIILQNEEGFYKKKASAIVAFATIFVQRMVGTIPIMQSAMKKKIHN